MLSCNKRIHLLCINQIPAMIYICIDEENKSSPKKQDDLYA
jgi:hypothetical protein